MDLRHLHDPWRYLDLGFAHLERNPPPAEGRWTLDLLRSGRFDELHDAQRRAAVEDGFRDAQAIIDAEISGQPRRDGWTVPYTHTAEPGPWVLEQAATQLRAIGSNEPAEAIYLFADTDANGRPLDSRDGSVYELGFEGDDLPPLKEAGFWSVTMYRTSNSLLVDNPDANYTTRPECPASTAAPTAAQPWSWPPSGRRAWPRQTGCRHLTTNLFSWACVFTTRARQSARDPGSRRRW